MDEIQVNTVNTNLEIDLEVDDEYNKRKEEEEIEYKKKDSVIDNYEKFPHKCQAEILGTICDGPILGRKFVCRYRPSIKNSCDHYQNINFCEYHYNCIISSNGGVKPEPYYEWYLGEAIYELIKKIFLEYK